MTRRDDAQEPGAGMDEPRTVSKATFGCLTLSLYVLLVMAATFALLSVNSAWGFRIDRRLVAGMSLPFLMLAWVAVDRVLRRYGLSRSGTVTQVQGRPLFVEPSEDGPAKEVAEARLTRGMSTFLLLGTPVMVLFLFVSARALGEEEPMMWWLGNGMGIFLTVGYLQILVEYGKPQARGDADGVTGCPSLRAMKRRFVPWSDVFSCEVQTIYDTFGKPVLLVPIFKGRHGETLMTLSLSMTPMVEQERIAKFIKAKLPETEVDPWLA